MTIRFVSAAALALAVSAAADEFPRTPAPEGAQAYIINLADGDTVSNPVLIQFGARGIGVAPAGVEWDNTGHHHLLINIEPGEDLLSQSLPNDDTHVHFGGGQTETTRDLPSGRVRLQLLMADHNHIPHDPPILSEPIFVMVE